MTTPDVPSMFDRRVVAVFAHPDDESLAAGGLLAWCAALGAGVSIVCMTRGTHGNHSHRQQTATDLGALRERELRAAADALGADDVVLFDHEDGMLPWADASSLESQIVDTISARQPDVVITFDADGLYWHPDHIAVYERTTAAVTRLALATRTPGSNGQSGSHPGPALYYVSMPPGAMRRVVAHVGHPKHAHHADTGNDPDPAGPPLHILGVNDPDAFGAEAATPTLVVDTGSYAIQKLRALKCHRSQMRGSALDRLDDREAPTFLNIEHYRRAPVGGDSMPCIERLAQPRDPAASLDGTQA